MLQKRSLAMRKLNSLEQINDLDLVILSLQIQQALYKIEMAKQSYSPDFMPDSNEYWKMKGSTLQYRW